MGRGLLKAHLQAFEGIGIKAEAGLSEAEKRRDGYNESYEYSDGLKSAYGIFFFQNPSMLEYQTKLKRKYRRSNMESVLGVKKIPCSNQITRLIDVVKPDLFKGVFWESIGAVEHYGGLGAYKALDGGLLAAIDGTQYYSSYEISCEHCLRREVKQKDGSKKTLYYHNVLVATIVRPGNNDVLPCGLEFIENGDGKKKQDCEHNAGKRLIDKNIEEFKKYKTTFLGDGLYADNTFCKKIEDAGLSYIFTCKPDDHEWLMWFVNNSDLGEVKSKKERIGKYHYEREYRWLNGVDIRAEEPAQKVNYVEVKEYKVETGELVYHNSWVTNKELSAENVEHIVACGRARWKIENGCNNIMKNYGYHLEHNFGHGKKHASEIYCMLNILAFLMHTMMWLLDTGYRKVRVIFGRREDFFNTLRVLFDRFLHNSWEEFLEFVIGDGAYDHI
jgi:hypothetical protein